MDAAGNFQPEITYKGELTRAMKLVAADPRARFIGYGLLAGRALGTLKEVPAPQLIETPVAENLMMGLAIGLSLRHLRPLVFIERADFLLNALDALVNHLAKIEVISHQEYTPTALVRVVVGNRTKGLQTGATHTQDFSDAVQLLCPNIPVYKLGDAAEIVPAYERALASLDRQSAILFEYKDLL